MSSARRPRRRNAVKIPTMPARSLPRPPEQPVRASGGLLLDRLQHERHRYLFDETPGKLEEPRCSGRARGGVARSMPSRSPQPLRPCASYAPGRPCRTSEARTLRSNPAAGGVPGDTSSGGLGARLGEEHCGGDRERKPERERPQREGDQATRSPPRPSHPRLVPEARNREPDHAFCRSRSPTA